MHIHMQMQERKEKFFSIDIKNFFSIPSCNYIIKKSSIFTFGKID